MRVRWMMMGAVVAMGTACTSDQSATSGGTITAPLYVRSVADADKVGTHVTPEEEVLLIGGVRVPVESQAQGQAQFRFNDDGTVDFKLIASNIDNVVQSHIHCGAFGANGPIRMWLYPNIGATGTALTGPTGRHDGVLAEGTFNPAGITCPGGQPLLDAIRAGLTYVNVHTSDGVADDPGPAGDYPGGEMRGQIDDHNHT